MSMPENNRGRKNLDAIRVYAPSRGNLAVSSEALPYTRVAEPLPKTEPRRRPVLVPNAPAKKRRTLADLLREYKFLPKLGAVVCVLAVAFSLIVMLSGFNSISAAQKDLNSLSKRVSEMENVVEKTNVEYLFSIDIGSAHDAATAAGMSYAVNPNAGN
ncbi:MAG: hypothetical protein K6G56_02755 [Clostridiales bacterium]|nr:hypothetical protein [Clostridiales bacterium]